MTHTSTDPLNNTTATYTYSGTYYGAYPTTATNALNQSTTYAYDFNTGLMTSMTDPNNQPTTYPSYDSMLRSTQANYPDSGQTTIAYNYSGNVFVGDTVTKKITSSLNKVTAQTFDGLGRPKQYKATVPTSTCSTGFSYVDTTYDSNGWTFSVSNPYCTTSDATYGLTKTYYDALNRVTSVVEQDGSAVSTSYTGNCAAVTDEAQKARTSCVDGAGRLTSVLEDPGSSPHLNYQTSYTYDALSNLLSVTQGGSRQRTFYYDSLSRLEKAINPESGTTCYAAYSGGSCQYASVSGYDADGNLLTKTDARGITTTYTYDGLNRLLTKTYSDGTPSAIYAYDQTAPWGFTLLNPIGRMTTSGTNNGAWLAAEVLSYDPVGRVSLNQQCTTCSRGWSFSMGYSYDYLGDITSHDNGAYTVGQGVTFTQTFDTAGRQTSLTSTYSDSQHPATLVTVNSYSPLGEIGKMTYGNGVMESSVYESRLQPCRMTFYLSGTPTSTCTKSLPSGNIQDFGFAYGTWGSTNNGNVTYWEAFGNQGFTRTYSYDSLNRLSSLSDGVTTNPCPGLSWSYDAWGNRTAQTVTSGSCGSSSLGYNTSNHITNSGLQYDASGNLTNDGTHSYTYDAENRITAVDGGSTASYVYNAHGQRVLRTAGGVTTEYYHDLSGNVLGEAQGTTVTTGYVYLNRQLLADYTGGTTYFVHQDHLGSTRLMTNISGCVADSLDYLPFGERNSVGSVPCTAADTTHKFTGKERDSESGLDNFGARYDSSQYGRFMSADPDNESGMDHPEYPQSWNGYAYVRNNPLNLTDPDGRNYWLCDTDDKQCVDFTDDQFNQFLASSPDVGITASGDLYAGATLIGNASYYNENIGLTLQQAGQMSQAGLNWAMLLTAPNYAAMAAAQVLVSGGVTTTLAIPASRVAPLLPLLQPAGAKLAQMIARSGVGYEDPAAFMQYAESFRQAAVQDGTFVQSDYLGGSTIYKVGNDFMSVASNGMIRSFVANANAGVGVVAKYFGAGGK